MIAYGEPPAHALWIGVFHAVSAFNNAGFSLYADSLMSYVTDPWVMPSSPPAVIIGGLGFPVVFELAAILAAATAWTRGHPDHRDRHAGLLVLGTLVILAIESGQPATLGALDGADQLLAASSPARWPVRRASTPSTSPRSPPRACSRRTC